MLDKMPDKVPDMMLDMLDNRMRRVRGGRQLGPGLVPRVVARP